MDEITILKKLKELILLLADNTPAEYSLLIQGLMLSFIQEFVKKEKAHSYIDDMCHDLHQLVAHLESREEHEENSSLPK